MSKRTARVIDWLIIVAFVLLLIATHTEWK